MLRSRFWMGMLWAFCWMSAPAFADVVMPPPSQCPEGSKPTTSHAGPTCEPTTCKKDKDCKSGQRCVSWPLCVEKRRGYSHGFPFTVMHATAVCPKNTCAKGSCQKAMRCVSASKAKPKKKPHARRKSNPQEHSCQSFSLSLQDGRGEGLLGLLMLLFLWRRKRR